MELLTSQKTLTTLKKIYAYGGGGWYQLLKSMGRSIDDPGDLEWEVPLGYVLDNTSVSYAFHVARSCFPDLHHSLWWYTVWCAERVRHLMPDERTTAGLDTLRKYLKGEMTKQELREASEPVMAAANALFAAQIEQEKQCESCARQKSESAAQELAWKEQVQKCAAGDAGVSDTVLRDPPLVRCEVHEHSELETRVARAVVQMMVCGPSKTIVSAVLAACTDGAYEIRHEYQKRLWVYYTDSGQYGFRFVTVGYIGRVHYAEAEKEEKVLAKEFNRLIDCYDRGVEYTI